VRKSIKLFEAQQLNEPSEMDDNNNRVKDKRNDRFAEGYHKWETKIKIDEIQNTIDSKHYLITKIKWEDQLILDHIIKESQTHC
jgi:hypothetical protein